MALDKFTFFDSYAKTASLMQDEQRLAFYDAIIGYMLNDELPSFDDVLLQVAWSAVLPNLESSIKRSKGGKKGGSSKSKASLQQDAKLADNKISVNAILEEEEIEVEEDKELEEEREIEGPSAAKSGKAYELLNALNEELGTCYTQLTQEQVMRLESSGCTVGDVRRMVSHKRREWQGNAKMRTALRPATLFGKNFTQYIDESRSTEVNRFAAYAKGAEAPR